MLLLQFFVLPCVMACIASDSASMASMASSDRSTPDQFGSTEYDPLLSPIGMLHILLVDYKKSECVFGICEL